MINLSICIPTYNRVELLKECVNAILKAIEFSKYNIEIVISNNCSNDKTEDYCIALTNKYKFIKYYKNHENVSELNFYIAAERANSNFVWLFSDDDILNINAIKVVCDALKSGYNFIVANYDLYDNKLMEIKKKNFLIVNKDLVLTDKNTLLTKFNLKLGYISCVIFNRQDFLEMPIETFDKYRTYGFSFVFGLYSSFKNNLKALIISEPLLIQRGANNPADINWWYKCFVEGSTTIFKELLNLGYNKQAINMAQKNVFTEYVISDLFWRKTKGQNSIKAIPYLLKYFYKFPLFLIYSILIITTPSILIKYLFTIKQKLAS